MEGQLGLLPLPINLYPSAVIITLKRNKNAPKNMSQTSYQTRQTDVAH